MSILKNVSHVHDVNNLKVSELDLRISPKQELYDLTANSIWYTWMSWVQFAKLHSYGPFYYKIMADEERLAC